MVSYTYHVETTVTFLPGLYVSIPTFCGLKQLKEIGEYKEIHLNLSQKIHTSTWPQIQPCHMLSYDSSTIYYDSIFPFTYVYVCSDVSVCIQAPG